MRSGSGMMVLMSALMAGMKISLLVLETVQYLEKMENGILKIVFQSSIMIANLQQVRIFFSIVKNINILIFDSNK